ncbi:MATE family efflux transporter [Bradyrhizobium sp. BR 10289]|uniref:MATE family efflux transporter n=1 Tax=Bradyrhizobium sp. BR 10289 TaxID=2749993 RepID=UPI001C64F1DE|nr:MATE family efflux transporter [Bradyrhizobium sp. BR 10289]MBW7973346.1 MATE family efflux transporter [Bradyrhizobium sp. BR 10289]
MLDNVQPQQPRQTGVQNHLAQEFVETLRLAVPMMLTQLGQIAMITTDLALIGRLGEEAVAAAALAHTVYFVSFTFGLGLMAAVSPLAAQAFGAGDVKKLRGALRVGLWVALLISLPMMASPLYGEHILLGLGQAKQPAALAQRYLNGLAWGIAPALGFIALRGMMSAVNRPQAPLWITLAAIPVNAVLVYCLIHGLFGLPELGLFGAGLATTLVNLCTFIAALAIAAWHKPFAGYHPLAHLWRIDWPLMRQLIVLGAPISFSLLLEYGLFSSAALLMGLISTAAIAAHQIALQITAVLFMVPLGIGMAATVRVGHAFGRNDPAAVKRAGLVAGVLGIALVSALTVAIILGRYQLGRLFFGSGEASAATVELTAILLVVGATFFIADGLQTIVGGALRGINDTRMTLVFAAIGYWGVAFPVAWLLAFHARLGAIGVWIGFSVGTFVYAGLLILRFRMLTRKLMG